MIPQSEYYEEDDSDELDDEFEEYVEPSKTYAMSDDCFIGFVDDEKAIEQAIYKLLSTEQFAHEIYSDYGVELYDLYGKDDIYVMSELKTRITEAVLNDDRIEEVEDFEISKTDKSSYLCKFTVVTTEQYEDIDIESEVDI